jgi:hypothetical protein
MAITASQVESSNTLEQFRQEFNSLQSDVSGLESGTIAFSTITSSTLSTSATLNILEDGVIVFEGATDDANETTLTVVDPTADRTISLPNETGTLISTGTTANTFITGQTTIASGAIASSADELLLSDADAGVFKRVTVDNLISSAGGLTALVADTSPQLGGNLDTNSQNILIDDAHFIGDENGNEQIIFQTTGSAVNQIDITNAATGSGPSIAATGDDTNINLTLTPKGSGKVIIDGNGSSGGVSIDDGNIDIRTGTGAVSKIKFYCESSNAHAQTLQAAPHSASSSSVSVLPTASGTLIGTGDTGTLPLVAIDIDGGTDIGEALVDADLLIVDNGAGGTNRKVAMSRIATYVGAAAGGFAIANLDIDGGTDIGAALATTDLIIVDDGAGGTNRKATLARLLTLTDGNATALAIALG